MFFFVNLFNCYGNFIFLINNNNIDTNDAQIKKKYYIPKFFFDLN